MTEKLTACKDCRWCAKASRFKGEPDAYYCAYPKDFHPYTGTWHYHLPEKKRPLCMFNTWGNCQLFEEKEK